MGIIGNVLTLLIYNKKNTTLTQKVFVNSLAILDLFVCVVVIPYSIMLELKMVAGLVLCHFMEFVRTSTVLASNTSLVIIAAERYIFVTRPVNLWTYRKKMVILATSLIFLVIPVAIPAGFTYSMIGGDENTPNTNSSVVVLEETFQRGVKSRKYCGYTTEFLTPVGADVYKIVQTSVFVLLILLMVFFYVSVYKALYKRAVERKNKVLYVKETSRQKSKRTLFPDSRVYPSQSGKCVENTSYS